MRYKDPWWHVRQSLASRPQGPQFIYTINCLIAHIWSAAADDADDHDRQRWTCLGALACLHYGLTVLPDDDTWEFRAGEGMPQVWRKWQAALDRRWSPDEDGDVWPTQADASVDCEAWLTYLCERQAEAWYTAVVAAG